MMERRVGYSKLMHLTGVTRADARSCLKQGKRGIAIERLIIMLYQLGYETTISVKERELSEDECDYFNATGRTASKFRPASIPGKDEDSIFKIRLLDRHGRTQGGTVPILWLLKNEPPEINTKIIARWRRQQVWLIECRIKELNRNWNR